MDGRAISRHFEAQDWFASGGDNLGAGICLRGLWELGNLFHGAELGHAVCPLPEWISITGLNVDEIAWTSFKTTDSSVGGLIKLSHASLSMISEEFGDDPAAPALTERRVSFSPCVVGPAGLIDETFVEFLQSLQSDAIRLRDEIAELPISFNQGRKLIFRGLFLCLGTLAAVRAIEYALAFCTAPDGPARGVESRGGAVS